MSSTHSNPEHTRAGEVRAGARPPVSNERPKAGMGDQMFMFILTAFEIGAAIAIVQYVKAHGGSDFSAYMWSLLPPLIGGAIYTAKTKDVSGASIAIFAFNLLSAGVAYFGSHDSRMLLYKDCFVTAIIGVIFGGSLLVGKPLSFWFGQRFATGGTREGVAWWNGLWKYPEFRKSQRLTSLAWAVVMLVEAAVKAWVISRSSFQFAYAVGQIIPFVAAAVAMAFTFIFARQSMKAAKEARARHGDLDTGDKERAALT